MTLLRKPGNQPMIQHPWLPFLHYPKKGMIVLTILISVCQASSQQVLQPGFDAREYAELLSLTYFGSSIPDSAKRSQTTDRYKLLYRSPEIGLLNRWSLYLRDDNVASIDLRGTVNQPASWLANFYAAMIPATGSLQISDSSRFDYQFATDPRAMIHVGWTLAIAHLATDIREKILKYHSENQVNEFLVAGHSQGGALATLLRSWLEYEKIKGRLPASLRFKTYCSAAPKVGNMYYAYDFDFINRNGWAFTVVNAADWVPETPISVQTLSDFNPTNPLVHTKAVLKKQKLLIRLAGGVIYDKLERKPRKAQQKLLKLLGRLIYKKGVRKVLPGFPPPTYASGSNYMRAGTAIILMPDKEYYEQFPESNSKFFTHHGFKAYSYLLKKWY